jgi:hypothetical protein
VVFQYRLRNLLVAVIAAAILLALFDWRHWPIASAVVCAVYVSLALVFKQKRRLVLLAILYCAYSPYLWLLSGYPWDDYRWGWIGMWPVLPGLLPGAYFFHATNETLEMACMGLAAVLFVAIATAVAARGKWFLVGTSLVVLALSILNSIGAYAAFRA